ncbi:WecB/TagA/CpsF family glycosyltransferase [Candidatus Woesebacteria bacterium]|nr:WecB/TagA/CpsF family glycosyltransferase [Candidatus Woesebacteria bacterium]
MKKVIKKAKISSNKVPKKIDIPVEIMNVVISGTQKSGVLKKIWLQRKEMLHIATVNPEFVMEARTNKRFSQSLKQCLTVADGWGIVWASKLQCESSKLQVDRISGTWLSEQIVAHAAEKGEKVFLLGGGMGVAEQAAANLSKIYPQLQIAWYSGAQTVKVEKNEEASMTIARINAFEPDYLLVAYGSPWQDIWIEDNRPYLRARVAMGVGGVFDEWAGLVRQCPEWIDNLGFKWLWRLVAQPMRLPRIIRVAHFGFIVLLVRLKRIF